MIDDPLLAEFLAFRKDRDRKELTNLAAVARVLKAHTIVPVESSGAQTEESSKVVTDLLSCVQP